MTKSERGSARGRIEAPGLAQVRSPPSLPPAYLMPVLPPKHVLSHRNSRPASSNGPREAAFARPFVAPTMD